MTDTIELLIVIGSDASLRYAPPSELKYVLDKAGASVELKMAVTKGDCAPLRVKLGIQGVPQTQAPSHGDEEEEEADLPLPERPEPDPSPRRPPAKRGSTR
ncbi:MAG: hypothetical protein J0I96_06350 [Rhodanobacter sp.]|uniref:hypothetical protein n=1 Tax=Rhodanobacter sp. PCA2 TaxID=2006117 RepID=UPI0015E712D0|nr:hypothetical protein [Rhodanobacter sp. PCA2]MBN8922702.1 hypothetical protein [Rhodanobacter sp.]